MADGSLDCEVEEALLGIRERAQTLGGSARIYGPPEGGTVVEISIPLGIPYGIQICTRSLAPLGMTHG